MLPATLPPPGPPPVRFSAAASPAQANKKGPTTVRWSPSPMKKLLRYLVANPCNHYACELYVVKPPTLLRKRPQ